MSGQIFPAGHGGQMVHEPVQAASAHAGVGVDIGVGVGGGRHTQPFAAMPHVPTKHGEPLQISFGGHGVQRRQGPSHGPF